MPFMYIVQCSDDSYYVGSTRDVEQRVWQHNHEGGALYTRRRQPVRLVYFEEYELLAEATGREKQVQGWRRAKREALIANEGAELLPMLAKKVFRAKAVEA